VTLVSAAFVIGVAGMAAKARRRPVVTGTPRMIGAVGEIIEFGGGEGWASVDGERWRVRAAQPLRAGQRVRITASTASPRGEPARKQHLTKELT
jgi:membrane-bound serine protease (ClpP class)